MKQETAWGPAADNRDVISEQQKIRLKRVVPLTNPERSSRIVILADL